MKELTVKWITNAEADSFDQKDDLGGLGGFFNDGMRWKDYIGRYRKQWHPHLETLRKSIIDNDIWHEGGWHQGQQSDSDLSVPLWSDGKYGTYSFRAWGDLMAAVWSEHYNQDYSYMSFYYMDVPEKPEQPQTREPVKMGIE